MNLPEHPAWRIDASHLRHALRTAIAATITLALTLLLDLDQGYWAVFSSILVMQAHVGGSIAASWARLLGTASGALLGALSATAADAWLGVGLAGLGAAMFVTVFFCALMASHNENLRLAGLTAAVVICLHGVMGGSALEIGLLRFLEVGLGIVVALAVSLAWPAHARVVLRHGLGKGLGELAALLAVLMEGRLGGGGEAGRVFHRKDAALRLLLRNRQLLSAALREPGAAAQGGELSALLDLEDRLAEHLLAMAHALEGAPPEGFHRHLAGELRELGAAMGAAMEELARSVSAKAPAPQGAALRLEAALAAAGGKLLDLRRQRTIAVYDLDEVMHFYSFYHALREAARLVLAELTRRGGAEAISPQPPESAR